MQSLFKLYNRIRDYILRYVRLGRSQRMLLRGLESGNGSCNLCNGETGNVVQCYYQLISNMMDMSDTSTYHGISPTTCFSIGKSVSTFSRTTCDIIDRSLLTHWMDELALYGPEGSIDTSILDPGWQLHPPMSLKLLVETHQWSVEKLVNFIETNPKAIFEERR